MYSKKVIVKKKTGLHARPGSNIVEMALSFNSKLNFKFGDKIINAKEILEVLTANINYDDQLIIEAEGTDEQEAVEKIAEYIETEE